METNTETKAVVENGKLLFTTHKVDEMTVEEAQTQMKNIDVGIKNLNNQMSGAETNIENIKKEITRLESLKQKILDAGIEEALDEDGTNEEGTTDSEAEHSSQE